jgi:hypothetical protein
MNGWEQLVIPRFICGHPKTPDNTYLAGGGRKTPWTRCKQCHKERMKNWWRTHEALSQVQG